ncbi:hypothetical protein LZ30DRAFT_193803 [Colletotrichum cereale]|nr:hypothetical protein LZ30DRAFT_193803 [Colletotrichum cereale]
MSTSWNHHTRFRSRVVQCKGKHPRIPPQKQPSSRSPHPQSALKSPGSKEARYATLHLSPRPIGSLRGSLRRGMDSPGSVSQCCTRYACVCVCVYVCVCV